MPYSSAQTWATLTIVSEPLFWMMVFAGFAVVCPPPPPQEARATREAAATSAGRHSRIGVGGVTRVMGVSCGFRTGYSMRMPSTAPTRSRTWLERNWKAAS